jgi:hypothetical protein
MLGLRGAEKVNAPPSGRAASLRAYDRRTTLSEICYKGL